MSMGKFYLPTNNMGYTTTTTTIPTNCYGKLYNWFAVNNTVPSNDIQYGYLYNGFTLNNIAKSNAHVPSNTEWEALSIFLGGDTISGNRLKEAGTTHWDIDSGADNSVGFTALPSGYRDSPGTFLTLYTNFFGWNSNPYHYIILQDNLTTLGQEYGISKYGISIRLIIDTPDIDNGDGTGIYIGNDLTHYPIKQINGVWWTILNLVETLYYDLSIIPEVTDNTTWSGLTTGARCSYNNDITLAYNGTPVPTLIPIANTNAHVPTSTEWETLSLAMGGDIYSGGHLKEAGLVHWNSPNTGADNYSRFTALPSSARILDGSFNDPNVIACFHVADQYDSFTEKIKYLVYANASLNDDHDLKTVGLSIRLIVDAPNSINDDGISGTYIGNDGQVYPCILIGTQWWLQSNLCETMYQDLSLIPNITDNADWAALTTGAWCTYNNDSTYNCII